MKNIATIALVTLREAARRKILWTALLAGALLLGIFAIALRLQVVEFQSRAMSPFVRYQVEAGMLMIGLYTCDLLAVVLTILTSIDTLAGEISSGTIQAIATKPISRSQLLRTRNRFCRYCLNSPGAYLTGKRIDRGKNCKDDSKQVARVQADHEHSGLDLITHEWGHGARLELHDLQTKRNGEDAKQ